MHPRHPVSRNGAGRARTWVDGQRNNRGSRHRSRSLVNGEGRAQIQGGGEPLRHSVGTTRCLVTGKGGDPHTLPQPGPQRRQRRKLNTVSGNMGELLHQRDRRQLSRMRRNTRDTPQQWAARGPNRSFRTWSPLPAPGETADARPRPGNTQHSIDLLFWGERRKKGALRGAESKITAVTWGLLPPAPHLGQTWENPNIKE